MSKTLKTRYLTTSVNSFYSMYPAVTSTMSQLHSHVQGQVQGHFKTSESFYSCLQLQPSSSYYYYSFHSVHFVRAQRLRDYHTHQFQTSHNETTCETILSITFYMLIHIAILDLEPDPDFRILIHIFKTTTQIITCDIPNHRACQVLHFIR